MLRNKIQLLAVILAVFATLAAVHAVAEPSCPEAALRRIDLQATRVAMFHERPITIVALGSSSTAGTGATAPDKTYPERLAATLRTAWPHALVTVVNEGVGGQMVDMVLDRIDSDVLAREPTLVIWQTGTNEAIRGMDPAQFAADLDEGVRRILASGADVVLMDSQIAPRVPENRVAEYDAIVAREAEKRHVGLFSRTGLMREWQSASPSPAAMIGPDGLHHTDLGYACIAASLGQAIAAASAKGIPVAGVGKK